MIQAFAKLVVAVPGTIVRATYAKTIPAQHVPCHGILFQALPTNVGKVYVGSQQMSRVALTNLFAMLPPPTTNVLPSFSAAVTIALNGLGVEVFYIDADNAGDGAIVTILVA